MLSSNVSKVTTRVVAAAGAPGAAGLAGVGAALVSERCGASVPPIRRRAAPAAIIESGVSNNEDGVAARSGAWLAHSGQPSFVNVKRPPEGWRRSERDGRNAAQSSSSEKRVGMLAVRRGDGMVGCAGGAESAPEWGGKRLENLED